MKRLAIVMLLALTACTPTTVQVIVTATPEPATETPIPTNTPEPTFTPAPTATPLYGGNSILDCQANWDYLMEDEDVTEELVNAVVGQILNQSWAPDSIGAILQECIMGGWNGWRQSVPENGV